MMVRDACLEMLARHYAGELVVAVYTTCFEWLAIAPDALTYVGVGAMGQASSHGLGLAIGRPDRRVWVFDGDGSLLMNLGTLVTVAGVQPRNYTHFVFQNGTYEANGAMPLPASTPIDFAQMAKAAGIPHAHTCDELDALSAWLTSEARWQAPAFVDLRVSPSSTAYPQRYDHIHSAEAHDAFRRALAELPTL